MKNKLQEGIKQVGNAAMQVSEKSKQMANSTMENVHQLSAKIQDESYKAMLKKYNPVFPEVYNSDSFTVPNMIVIVDDAVCKGIEVCEGSIGWLSTQKDVEILHLYDEAVEFSGLKFIPVASCDSVYYVDNLDRNRYIKLDGYFDRMQNSKLAELEHIAFSLGAKRYTVEMQESTKEHSKSMKKAFENVKLPIGKSKKGAYSSAEINYESLSQTSKKVLKEAEFANGAEPVHPNLRWFKLDDEINNLIDMRLSGQIKNNEMKRYSIELEGSDYSNISAGTAAKIDAAVSKINAGAGYDMVSQHKKESSRKLVFKIEF